MTYTGTGSISRRGLLGAFALTAVAAAPTFSKAAGFLRGAGDIRQLRMYCGRTGESINTVYWIEGTYIRPALAEVAHRMRDWHSNESRALDLRAIAIMDA